MVGVDNNEVGSSVMSVLIGVAGVAVVVGWIPQSWARSGLGSLGQLSAGLEL